jgi:hypothetical protein
MTGENLILTHRRRLNDRSYSYLHGNLRPRAAKEVIAVLKEVWARVDVSKESRLALVLDVSESAQAHWPGILRLALDFLGRVPEKCQCSVYFLGDSRPYERDTLHKGGAALYKEHRGRASVISPLLDELAEEQDIACIVLCSGRIYDLEDWVGTAFATRLVLANFGELPVSNGSLFECKASVQQIFDSPPLRTRLGAPIRVEISGQSVMPFYWDNPAYTLDNCKLVSQGRSKGGVLVGVLCLSQSDIRATAVMQGNFSGPAELTICSHAAEVVWERASSQDAARFRQVIQDGLYDCNLCPRQHSGGSLRYPCEKRLLGRYIYSFLLPLNGPGFVLVCDGTDGVWYSQHVRPALRLSDEIVAVVAAGGLTDIYQFRSASGEWQRTQQTFKQHELVGTQTYAIAI